MQNILRWKKSDRGLEPRSPRPGSAPGCDGNFQEVFWFSVNFHKIGKFFSVGFDALSRFYHKTDNKFL